MLENIGFHQKKKIDHGKCHYQIFSIMYSKNLNVQKKNLNVIYRKLIKKSNLCCNIQREKAHSIETSFGKAEKKMEKNGLTTMYRKHV